MKRPDEKPPFIPGGLNPWLFLLINVGLLLVGWWMFLQIEASPVMMHR